MKGGSAVRRLPPVCKRTDIVCALWIAVCFTLTSAVYLSWVYRLMDFAGSQTVDLYSMGVGYCAQAMGAGVGLYLFRRRPASAREGSFRFCVLIFCAVSLPALMGGSLLAVMGFGLLMNLLCGLIAAYYLYGAAIHADAGRRGFVFGCGYGLSTLIVFLLSMIGESGFLRSRAAWIGYLPLAAGAAWMAGPLLRASSARADAPQEKKPLSAPTAALAVGTVFLLSLVKNLGFSFPSADIQTGISIEFSRLFYAAGLILAGIISDKNRKYGAVCTAAALAVPFVMQAIAGEPIPALICWGLDYLFFGFFSVFRVLLFMDMAAQTGRWYLAPLGLVAGRMGDAAGTALCMALSVSRLLLLGMTLGLYMLTLFLFFRLYQALYAPETVQVRSEREIFEGFSIQHDLSSREKEVLRLVLAERSNAEIAEALFVSESTIKYHVHNLLQKTGCKSRQELIRKYNMVLYPQITEK